MCVSMWVCVFLLMLAEDEWTSKGDVVVAIVTGSVVVFGVVVLLVVFYNTRKQWHPNDYHLR